jgi:hypothetical protein
MLHINNGPYTRGTQLRSTCVIIIFLNGDHIARVKIDPFLHSVDVNRNNITD